MTQNIESVHAKALEMKLQLNTCTLCLCLLICGRLLLISSPPVYAAANFTIGWDPNDEEDLDGYGIYVSISSPVTYDDHLEDVFVHQLPNRDNPQWTLIDFEDGTYYIAATAFDTDGNESDFSNHLEIRVSGSEVTHIASSNESGGGGGGGGCLITSAEDRFGSPSLMSSLGLLCLLSFLGLLISLRYFLRNDCQH
ncbi:hypothetical protein D1BOALGB6SA_8801 [Olavius sp. associated proteobacterium Delta 1]|nr:hypothetical protein D1BOALGB6SA_8801 [Olavius sp. associated proteobacterium Delta 1]